MTMRETSFRDRRDLSVLHVAGTDLHPRRRDRRPDTVVCAEMLGLLLVVDETNRSRAICPACGGCPSVSSHIIAGAAARFSETLRDVIRFNPVDLFPAGDGDFLRQFLTVLVNDDLRRAAVARRRPRRRTKIQPSLP
jgi:hypothetical protein